MIPSYLYSLLILRSASVKPVDLERHVDRGYGGPTLFRKQSWAWSTYLTNQLVVAGAPQLVI